MSESVQISVTEVVTGIALGAILPAAVCALGVALAASALSSAAQRALRRLLEQTPSTVDTLEPVSRQAAPLNRVDVSALPRHEAAIVQELASVAPLAIRDSQGLASVLRARPVQEWAGIIRQQHAELFCESLTAAVARACQRLGFRSRQLSREQLVAEDGGGRALAVRLTPDGNVTAEVLGVADGSCRMLVDRFLEALQAEGVRVASTRRHWTGGVPQTALARSWISGKARKGTANTAAPVVQDKRVGVKGSARMGRIKG